MDFLLLIYIIFLLYGFKRCITKEIPEVICDIYESIKFKDIEHKHFVYIPPTIECNLPDDFIIFIYQEEQCLN